jgi:hypothetical protein
MRVGVAILVGLTGLSAGLGARVEGTPAPPARRYGISADLETYPQGTPKQALASALKAVAAKRLDYLVAHLADPTFVDDRVKRLYGGRFAEQVEDTRARLDPVAVKQLRRFLDGGEWAVGKAEAVARLKGVKERCVRFRLQGGRWFLEHPSAPPKPAED